MRIELRVNNLDRINEFLDLNIDSVIIGHEACPHQLYKADEILGAFYKFKSKGINVKFQAPLSYEKHFENVFDTVKKVVNENEGIEIVVNDFGMLYAIRERGLLEKCKPVIGHGISYSYENCPWHEHILQLEKEEIQEHLLCHNLNSRENMEILNEFGVKQIEIDILDKMENSYKSFKENGFALNGNMDFIIVSIARACHVARFYGRENEIGNNCRTICAEPVKITSTHRWNLFDNTHSRIKKEVREMLPQMKVFSNIICVERKTDLKSPILEYLDTVTVDSRIYSKESLGQRIDEIRNM